MSDQLSRPDCFPYFPRLPVKAEKEKWKAWNLSQGLGALPVAMAAELEKSGVEIRRNCPIRLIERDQSGSIRLNRNEEFDHVISSISPALLASSLAPGDFSLELIELLSQYQETKLFVQLVELEQMSLPAEVGFGFLVPSCEDQNLLGITYGRSAN